MTGMSEVGRSAVHWTLIDDRIMQVTLESPPSNALGLTIVEGLSAALDAAESQDPHVVVVTSSVPGFFAAGADIKYMVDADVTAFSTYGDALRTVLNRLATPTRLSVAAIDGLALGGGLELAMACTLRVAGHSAMLGLPEVRLGLIPGAGGTQRLPHLVGRGRALDIMLTGRQVAADEALAIGLVDRVVDPGAAFEAAMALASELRSYSLPAQQALVRTVDAAYDRRTIQGLAYEADEVGQVFARGEAREGMQAFLERRRPNFS
jgi:enoyl-CoA hydratase